MTRALKTTRVEEVRALLEQGADASASMVPYLPKTGGYMAFFYLLDLSRVTGHHMLTALVDGGWRRERIAECLELMNTFKSSIYSVSDHFKEWNTPCAWLLGCTTNLEMHNDITSRLKGAMQRAMPAEADERERVRVVPPGVENASEVLHAPRRPRATDTDPDAGADPSFLLGYFDIQASRVWAPGEQPRAGPGG